MVDAEGDEPPNTTESKDNLPVSNQGTQYVVIRLTGCLVFFVDSIKAVYFITKFIFPERQTTKRSQLMSVNEDNIETLVGSAQGQPFADGAAKGDLQTPGGKTGYIYHSAFFTNLNFVSV